MILFAKVFREHISSVIGRCGVNELNLFFLQSCFKRNDISGQLAGHVVDLEYVSSNWWNLDCCDE